jgi:predicted secreted hydrolase
MIAWPLCLWLIAMATPPVAPDGFRLAVPPYAYRFPEDHAAHPAYRTEWWYYTGHLESGARRFGYQLTFFRVGVSLEQRSRASVWAPHTVLFAHLALTDVSKRRFAFHEVAGRPGVGTAGADSSRYRVWIDDWSADLAPDGRTHRLRARAEGLDLELDLRSLKPEVLNGEGGVSRKGEGLGEASHYVSLTRMATSGSVGWEGRRWPVTGLSWMDHEFGSDALGADQVGWDWFSIQLDDGRELMLYLLRRRDGSVEPASSGTWVGRDGRTRHLPLGSFEVRPTGTWKSQASGGTYPAGWTVAVPSAGVSLRLVPSVADQELRTGDGLGIVYWEGSVRVEGRGPTGPVRGQGYVELTGYAGMPLRF